MEMMENAAVHVRVTSSERGYRGGWCRFQTKDLGEGTVSGWSASPKDTCRSQKMAAVVMNNAKNLVPNSNFGNANGDDGYGPIAGREVVTIV